MSNKIISKLLLAVTLITSTYALAVSGTDTAVPVVASHGMVVTEQALASKVGIDILRAGGNAIDAAVAVGYALAVVNPCCGNLGGGGFMTIHLATGKNIFINFRERAPLAAKPNMYLDIDGNVIPDKSTKGYLAVAVPGTVLGLDIALKKYGTMTRQQVMAPAIQFAEAGFILGQGDVKMLQKFRDVLGRTANVAAIFLNNGKDYQVGDRLVQKDLAISLHLISDKGPDAFYKGPIAETIVQASDMHQGILSLQDFSAYFVEELQPVTCNYHGDTIISAPPPSSGGTTLCEMLNILESYPLKKMGFHSTQSVHYIVEAMRFAFYDRNNQLGDPDFVNNPVAHLVSKTYAADVRKQIKVSKATPSEELGNLAIHEGVNTTHYSILDKAGNAVAVTYTLNSLFGAGVIAGNTGFFLNNEMDDFTSKPNSPNQFGLIQSEKNNIQAGKRPLSAMTPTIILLHNTPVMVVGSPGGPRIITATLQTILNVLDYDMNIQQAIDAPRFHHQCMPDSIDIEPATFTADTMKQLTAMKYNFTPVDYFGSVEAIYVNPKTKQIDGGSDNRRSAGKAIGY
jgi:gamma-glutamyltranspeptidase / glutathione hydrolase